MAKKISFSKLQFILTPDSFIVDDIYQVEEDIVKRWQNDFKKNRFYTLYNFGFHDFYELSFSAHFLHMISETFIDELLKRPELELARENIDFIIQEECYDKLLQAIPFVIGSEHISKSWLENIFKQLHLVFVEEIKQYHGSVQMYIAEKSQHLQVAKRIYFHFVDYQNDEFPFAFMATYASKDKGRIRHLPLKHALVEYKDDRNQLLTLLSCLNKVADVSPLIASFMENGEMFHPIVLTKEEAYELLQSIPLIEKCGIKCRVPNCWKKRYSSISMQVSVGDEKPTYLGFDSLLEMQAKLTVNGTPLTKEDIQQLMKEEDGLVWLKGQWIEVKHDKLQELLEQIKNYDGSMTLKEALGLQLQVDKNADVGTLITNGKWLNDLLMHLKKPSKLKEQPVPREFQATLRPYQNEGYTWLNFMYQLGFGACLADDMGLGKTVQVLAFIESLKFQNKHKQVLLVVPASLIGNWEKEIQRFAPQLNYFILHGKTPQQMMKQMEDEKPFLIITTYGLAVKIEALQNIEWECVILDEAQAIKNPLTKQTKAIKKLSAHMKVAMTGTPIENELSNLWSLFDFLNKGLLGTSKQFKDFTRLINIDPQNSMKLRNMVSPFILRRLKTDKTIISDLPDKIEIIDTIQLSKKQVFLYHKVMNEVKEKLENSEGIERRGVILATLMKLKQICNHPDQYLHKQDFLPKDSGKFIMLKELCETIYQKRERVLVFTQYREICEDLDNYLEKIFHKKGFVLHGGVSVKKRQEIVDKFNSEEYYPYIVLSLKAAGTGLNLTSANHVIHFDRWWNPAVENQASDRAFRIGQKKNVFVHKFVCVGSVEEKIDQMINSKKALADEIIASGKQSWITELSNDELLSLLRLEGE